LVLTVQGRAVGAGRNSIASHMKIRAADPEDVGALVEIANSVVAEDLWVTREPSGIPFEAKDFTKAINSDGALFVACDNVQIVGFIRLAPESDNEYHFGMMVREGCRRAGYGKALLDAGILWAVEHGIRKLFLVVYCHNVPAIGLYKRSGFVEVKRLRGHCVRANGDAWDALVMVLDLC
jgi:ribosomal protein S18 acetylase RimI-like enzyme